MVEKNSPNPLSLPPFLSSPRGPSPSSACSAGPLSPHPLSPTRCQAGPTGQGRPLPPAPPLLRGTAPPPAFVPRLPHLPSFNRRHQEAMKRRLHSPSLISRALLLNQAPLLNALKPPAPMAIDGHYFRPKPPLPFSPYKSTPRGSELPLRPLPCSHTLLALPHTRRRTGGPPPPEARPPPRSPPPPLPHRPSCLQPVTVVVSKLSLASFYFSSGHSTSPP
jgi:hypothetical protein